MMIEDKNEFLPISIGNEKIVDLIEIGPKKNEDKKKKTMPIKFGNQIPWLKK